MSTTIDATKRRKMIDALKTRTEVVFEREVRKVTNRTMTRTEFLTVFAKDVPESCHEELWGTFLYDYTLTAQSAVPVIMLPEDEDYDNRDLPLQDVVDLIEGDVEDIANTIATCVVSGKPAGGVGERLIETKIGLVREDIAQYLPQIEAALQKK